MLELTVFISVKIDNLNELSRLMPEIVNKEHKMNSDNTKINTEIKYLLISWVSNTELENSSLFINILSGLAWESNSLIENLKSK